MKRFDGFLGWTWSILVIFALAFTISGCDGDDGKDGLDGMDGMDGQDGQDGAPAPVPDPVTVAIESAEVESCNTCHGGVGDGHQAVYTSYSNPSTLALDITDVVVADAAVGFDVTVDFSVSLNGAPYIDPMGSGLSLDSTGFYFADYDGEKWVNQKGGFNFSLSNSNISSNGDGTYTLEQNVPVDPRTFTTGALMGRIANGKLIIDEPRHLELYADNASDFWEFGDINAFASPANVEGCENCHGKPYFKHGNYPGMVAGTPDFTVCRSCHNESTAGTHPDWQFMVDQPEAWANGTAYTPEQVALYAYTRDLVNDVHMSHAMEFPYPQSMSNCVTCHEGQIDQILADENFTEATCRTCHVVTGENAWPALVDENTGEVIQPAGDYYQPHRPPPIAYLWTQAGVAGLDFHNLGQDCAECHRDGGFATNAKFSDLHTGYDKYIYDADGNRYANDYTVSIDSVAYDGVADTLTVEYSGSDALVTPELLVSFYGWDTKDFIVPSHWRDANRDRFEYELDDVTPLFTRDDTVVAPDYKVTANLSAYAAELTDDIPTLIDNMDVTKIEVTVVGYIDVGLEENISLTAATATYDLMSGGLIDNYFQGTKAIAGVNAADTDENKCNACHDQLSVTFHSGDGRAGEMTVCRNCHASTNGGSHLEMQSRSIEGYVHAIHSFQEFDVNRIFEEFDAVEAKRYDQHIGHEFPRFTSLACEACHNPGTYNVPDQSKSMPGLLSASRAVNTWYEMVPAANGDKAQPLADRNIGAVPEYVVGPASKACGGCHRAELINKDLAGDLAAFNAHTDAFGTLVVNDDDDEFLFGIIDAIMTWFE